mmetsp:Transcript_71182/g.169950  ORF Transcript_71182/g.169950 Transcript_71182/m.169950 type:complete len:210 (+) Transcript_71182:1132-1761(+)
MEVPLLQVLQPRLHLPIAVVALLEGHDPLPVLRGIRHGDVPRRQHHHEVHVHGDFCICSRQRLGQRKVQGLVDLGQLLVGLRANQCFDGRDHLSQIAQPHSCTLCLQTLLQVGRHPAFPILSNPVWLCLVSTFRLQALHQPASVMEEVAVKHIAHHVVAQQAILLGQRLEGWLQRLFQCSDLLDVGHLRSESCVHFSVTEVLQIHELCV